MKNPGTFSLLILTILMGVATVHANTTWGICPDDLQNGEPIANYYSGGYGGFGSGPGPDIGVSFTGQMLTTYAVGPCRTWEGHEMVWVAGDSIMNVRDGLTIISFYTHFASHDTTTMSLFTGIDGTNNLMAQQTFSDHEWVLGCDPSDWCSYGLQLDEPIHSVVFTGDGLIMATLTSGGFIVPEPGTIILLGTALLGIVERLRRSRYLS